MILNHNFPHNSFAIEFVYKMQVLYHLVPRPHYSARTKRFGSRVPSEDVRAFPARSPRIGHRSDLTEKASENAVQGLRRTMQRIVNACFLL